MRDFDVFADMEYYISQLADIRVATGSVLSVDYASEAAPLSAMVAGCRFLC
jgi:hypothetical protein